MIQRVQSIFLFAIAVGMIVMVFSPIWEKKDPDSESKIQLSAYEYVENSNGAITKEKKMYIAGLAVLVGIVAFISLISYKDRLKQMKLGMLNSLLMAALLGIIIYHIHHAEKNFLPDQKGVYQMGLYLLIGAAILNIVANRFIKRDEKIVRDSNRMR